MANEIGSPPGFFEKRCGPNEFGPYIAVVFCMGLINPTRVRICTDLARRLTCRGIAVDEAGSSPYKSCAVVRKAPLQIQKYFLACFCISHAEKVLLQLFDAVAQLGGAFELQLFGGGEHLLLQLRDQLFGTLVLADGV